MWYQRIWVPFLVSRGLIAFSAICVTQILTQHEQVIPFPAIEDWPRLLHPVLFFSDSGFYMWILLHGYVPGPYSAAQQTNWPFFPLYPLLIKGLSSFFQCDAGWLGILLSNVALLGSLALLHSIVAADWGAVTADTAVWLLALFPTSYFLSGFRPEALFLFLTLVAYWEARHARWWSAGLTGALAAATRPQGVLLVALLLCEGIHRHGWRSRQVIPIAGAIGLTGAGLAAFMAYLDMQTGNPIAFVSIQAAWERELVVPGSALTAFFAQPYLVAHRGWDLGVTNVPLTLLGLCAGIWLLVLRQPGLGLYTLASVLLALSTNTFLGAGRYVAIIFPLYLSLAVWLSRRSPAWRDAALGLSAGLLALLSLLVALDVYAARG